jgi:hypothetical protein
VSHFQVIKPEELTALHFLPDSHPSPVGVEWINRGTDRPLRKQSVDLLMRTMFSDILSPSVVKLHRSSGLRVAFRTEAERWQFARQFSEAKDLEQAIWSSRLTMTFDSHKEAADAAEALVGLGLPKHAVSILWRSAQFIDTEYKWLEGHSLASVAGSTAGGSIAGLALGVALIAVPGIGQIAAIGGLAAAQAAPVVSGIFGATVAAIAKMMTDTDVEGVALQQYAERKNSRRSFVSVDLSQDQDESDRVWAVLKQYGGRTVKKTTL